MSDGQLPDPAVERGLAVLLGLDRAAATAAVASLVTGPAAAHGLLLPGVVAAARWGCDVREALNRFAAGERIPADWSDFEARTARGEAKEDLEDALKGVRPPPQAAGPSATVAPWDLGEDDPVVEAVIAARQGHRRWSTASSTPQQRHALRILAAWWGATIVDDHVDVDADSAPPRVHAGVGLPPLPAARG